MEQKDIQQLIKDTAYMVANTTNKEHSRTSQRSNKCKTITNGR